MTLKELINEKKLNFEIVTNKKPKIKKINGKYTHKNLVDYAAWLLKTTPYNMFQNGIFKCSLVLKEFVTYSCSIPDVIGFLGSITIMVECKTSYQDFKNDKKKMSVIADKVCGNYRFYFFNTKELAIKCSPEIPEFYGVIYIDELGQIFLGKKAEFMESSKDVIVILMSVIRRLMTKQQIEKYLGEQEIDFKEEAGDE